MAKSKKIAIVVAAIALIAVIGVVGSTLAFFTDNDSKTNTFTMGNVNGTLEETKEDGSKGTLDPDTGITYNEVLPGDQLSKRPFMVLGGNSADAYARIKLTWDTSKLSSDEQKAMFAQFTPQLVGVGDKWVYNEADGYYYYQDVIKAGNSTQELFQTVSIPQEWTNTMKDVSFALKVEGDFIQADNFTPGTDQTTGKINSWGQVTIEQFQAPQQ